MLLDQNMQSELLRDLSTEVQDLVVGGGKSTPYIVGKGGPGIVDVTDGVVGVVGGLGILDDAGNIINADDDKYNKNEPPVLYGQGKPGLVLPKPL